MSGPAIATVYPEVEGAIIQLTPYIDLDSDEAEYAYHYRVYYTDDSDDEYTDVSTHYREIPAHKGGYAVIDGLTGGGEWYFAVRAIAADGTTLVPDSATSDMGWTSAIDIPSSESDTTSVGAARIHGTVNVGALNISAGASATMHVLAFATDGHLAGAGRKPIVPMTPLTSYLVSYLPDGVAPDGTAADSLGASNVFDLTTFVDKNSTATLAGFDNSHDYTSRTVNIIALQTHGELEVPLYDKSASFALHSGDNTLLNPVTLATPSTRVFTVTHTRRNLNASGREISLLYMVSSGANEIIQATRLPWIWDSVPFRDLWDITEDLGNDVLVPTTFVATSDVQATPPAPGQLVKFRVKYSSGTSEDLTSEVHDTLLNGLAITASPVNATTGHITSLSPSFRWTAPSVLAGNAITHYYLRLTGPGYDQTSDIPSSAPTVWTLSDLSPGPCSLKIIATDRYGDTEVLDAAFTIDP